MKILIDNHLTLEEYNSLRSSVQFVLTTPQRAQLALNHSLYLCVIRDLDGNALGMARVVGDGGYTFFICDVIVKPEFQRNGFGKLLIENILSQLENDVSEGETIMVNLMSAYQKESFYEKHGFFKRPFGCHGSGMSRWISK